MKKLLIILILIFGVSSIAKGWHVVTGGFKTSKIIPPSDVQSEITETFHLNDESLKIFEQEFHYLDKGCQVYVFESKDQNYVIKFLRHHKYKPHFWMNFTFGIKWLSDHRESYRLVKKDRILKNFLSYLMSYDELKELTEVVYVHLGPTNYINKKLIVRDRFNQKWHLDLDHMHFVVQRKAKPLKTLLMDLYNEKKLDEAKELIDKYFAVLKKRTLKGIKNTDHSGFIRNMAFLNDKVIEIDVGGYRKVDELLTKQGFQVEFSKFSKNMIRWSKKKMPLLQNYISDRSRTVLNEALTTL
jgi:hypothetical protein